MLSLRSILLGLTITMNRRRWPRLAAMLFDRFLLPLFQLSTAGALSMPIRLAFGSEGKPVVAAWFNPLKIRKQPPRAPPALVEQLSSRAASAATLDAAPILEQISTASPTTAFVPMPLGLSTATSRRVFAIALWIAMLQSREKSRYFRPAAPHNELPRRMWQSRVLSLLNVAHSWLCGTFFLRLALRRGLVPAMYVHAVFNISSTIFKELLLQGFSRRFAWQSEALLRARERSTWGNDAATGSYSECCNY